MAKHFAGDAKVISLMVFGLDRFVVLHRVTL